MINEWMSVFNTMTQKVYALFFLMVYMLCGFSSSALADSKVGDFTMVRGNVDEMKELIDAPVSAVVGMASYLGSTVRTKGRSRTKIVFLDGSVLNMGPNHMMKIKEFFYDEEKGIRKTLITVLRGSVRATVAKMGGDADSVFEIETPTAVIAVRGTDFFVNVTGSGTTVTLNHGAVNLRSVDPNISGMIQLRPGQQSFVSKGKAPSPAVKVPVKIMQSLIKASTKSDVTGATSSSTTKSAATTSSTSSSTTKSTASTSSTSSSTTQSTATTSNTSATQPTASTGMTQSVPSVPVPPAPVNIMPPVVALTLPSVAPVIQASQQQGGAATTAQPPVQVAVPITNIVPALQTTPVNVNVVF